MPNVPQAVYEGSTHQTQQQYGAMNPSVDGGGDINFDWRQRIAGGMIAFGFGWDAASDYFDQQNANIAASETGKANRAQAQVNKRMRQSPIPTPGGVTGQGVAQQIEGEKAATQKSSAITAPTYGILGMESGGLVRAYRGGGMGDGEGGGGSAGAAAGGAAGGAAGAAGGVSADGASDTTGADADAVGGIGAAAQSDNQADEAQANVDNADAAMAAAAAFGQEPVSRSKAFAKGALKGAAFGQLGALVGGLRGLSQANAHNAAIGDIGALTGTSGVPGANAPSAAIGDSTAGVGTDPWTAFMQAYRPYGG